MNFGRTPATILYMPSRPSQLIGRRTMRFRGMHA